MKMNSFAIAIFALSSVSVAYAANPASGKTVANMQQMYVIWKQQ